MKTYRLVHEIELGRNHPFKPQPNRANRWNDAHPVTYTSECLALAALEILGGWSAYESISGYRIFTYTLSQAEVEDALQTYPDLDIHSREATKRFGDDWARTRRSHALLVPSLRLPLSLNYLINPLHGDFDEARIEEIEPLLWDRRIAELIRSTKQTS